MLVSKLIGCRAKGHLRKSTSCPVTMKSFEVRCTAGPNQFVFGVAAAVVVLYSAKVHVPPAGPGPARRGESVANEGGGS